MSTPRIPQLPAVGRNEVMSHILRIKEVFELHFDRSWLAVVIDELPLENRTVREIREFLSITETEAENEARILAGLDALRRYIWTLKRHLLPRVRELLGVSAFCGENRVRDRSQYVIRSLTAFALPYNLAKLESLVDDLDYRYKQLIG